MKIEQKVKFVPVVITLETMGEVSALWELMYLVNVGVSKDAAVLSTRVLDMIASVLHPFRKPSR